MEENLLWLKNLLELKNTKNKIYKYITAIPENMHIDKLDNIVKRY